MMKGIYNGNGKVRKHQEKEELKFRFKKTDESAERCILGSFIEAIVENKQEILNYILKNVKKEYFLAQDVHKRLWSALNEYLLTTPEEERNEFTLKNFLRSRDEDLWNLAVAVEGDASPLSVVESAIKSVKNIYLVNSILSEILQGTTSYENAKELYEKLKEVEEKLEEELKEEKEDAKSVKEKALSLRTLKDAFLNRKEREYVIPEFIPKKTLIGISAKPSSGKSLLMLMLIKKYFIPAGYKVVLLDMDNLTDTLGERLHKVGLIDELDQNLFVFTRETADIKANSNDWKLIKEWLLNEDEHYIVILDTLKDFATGYDLNSDTDAGIVMEELKALASKHTVIFLHHVRKQEDENNPYKNSTTINEKCEVFYHLKKDPQTGVLKLRAFKDRIRVKPLIEFEIVEKEDGSLDLEPVKDPRIKELQAFVRAVYKAIEEGFDTKTKISRYVADNTDIGEKKAREMLDKYHGKLWVTIQGDKAHYKVYKPLIPLEKALLRIEQWLSKESLENDELGNDQKPTKNPASENFENQELGNDKNPVKLETVENEELGKSPYIYKEDNCQVENLTEEISSIKSVIQKLLEGGVLIDLGVRTINKPPTDVELKEIAEDPTLKSELLTLYIAYENGDINGWEYLINEVKNGERNFQEAVENFEELRGIDF